MNVLYQFKLTSIDLEPMVAVVKEGSRVLECLKAGDIVPVKYYSSNRPAPAESKNTRIKYISKHCSQRFRGHYMIGLETDMSKNGN